MHHVVESYSVGYGIISEKELCKWTKDEIPRTTALKFNEPDDASSKCTEQRLYDWDIQFILRNKVNELGNYMTLKGESNYAVPWWNSFNSKLKSIC